ncbi:MAG: cupredoxin domain-containing protein [Actinomycetota bacterium]|nr:cupredoxin domain-containing protein [Actinomycetota bacterium]
MSKLWKLSLVLVALSMLLAACGTEEEDTAAQEQSVTVEAFDNYYEQTTIALEPGAEATITLANGGGVAHSIDIPDLDFELEAQSGESPTSTFTVPNEPGTLDFYCKFHPDEMTGAVTIGGVDQPVEEDVDTEEDADAEVDVETEEDGGATTDDEADY